MSETPDSAASPHNGGEAAPLGPLRFATSVGTLASGSILFLAVLLSAEVVARQIFGASVRGLYEIAELLIVVVVFLGIAQAEVAKNHVRVTLFTDRLPNRAASIVRGSALLLAGIFLSWMFIALSGKALDSFETGEFKVGLLNFPVWPSRLIVAFGIGLLVAVTLYKGVVLITSAIRPTAPNRGTNVR